MEREVFIEDVVENSFFVGMIIGVVAAGFFVCFLYPLFVQVYVGDTPLNRVIILTCIVVCMFVFGERFKMVRYGVMKHYLEREGQHGDR